MTKRAIDLILSLLGLLLCWPLLLVVAALIKLDSPGPILFRQARVGLGFRPFTIYKFRTMIEQAPKLGGSLTVGRDARITRLGHLLRRYKVDELPQLFNVLRGDMSVVGPRPEVSGYVDLFRKDYARILTVRPGLTDFASLKYLDEAAVLGNSERPEETYRKTILPNKILLAKHYVEHASFLFDLAIVVQTALCLLRIPVVVCELPESLPQLGNAQARRGVGVRTFILNWRRPMIVILDIGLIVLSNYLAFWLRFDGAIPADQAQLFVMLLPALVIIRGVAFFMLRLNEGLWRYVSIWDLQNILAGVLLSSLLFCGWVYWGAQVGDYPRSVIVIDSVLLIGLVAGVRLPSRVFQEAVIYRSKKKVLIIGSGDTAERIVREMRTHPSGRYQPIGYIDAEDALSCHQIHGVRSLGALKDAAGILAQWKPEEVVLALPHAMPAQLREIIADLESCKVSIKMLPGAQNLAADKSAMSQIRNLAIEDLLPRAPINLNAGAVRDMVKGKCVLITGAGGSIGSELSRQIASWGPDALILYERHENSLYTIGKELEDRGHSAFVHPIIGDVTDTHRLSSTMEQFRPSILFHAAAHKHVPLVELNPSEAFKNNCLGTRIVADTAHRHGVERFVLISTDKAVNPSSVMGATKRVAELIVKAYAGKSQTKFLTVRFGNVLGSNGSVLLRFQEQIRAGGPVTVTHPTVRRYFMLIPEAVQLVMQAASIGEQGAAYVLDMGEQIKVLDLARNLIRLSGFIPGQEIPIQFTGLRPGEKLKEELVGEGEKTAPSPIEKISRILWAPAPDTTDVAQKLAAMEHGIAMNDASWVLERLQELVPAFRHADAAAMNRPRRRANKAERTPAASNVPQP